MKAFFASIVALCCVAILILGNIHWNNKTVVSGGEKKVAASSESSESAMSEPMIDEEQITDALSYASNWPEEARLHLEQSLINNQPYRILFAGSTALGDGSESWPELVKQRLYDTYGEDILDISTQTFDLTTKEFKDMNKYKDLLASDPDLIIFEPFTFKDNGLVVIEDSIEYINEIIENVNKEKEDIVFILQPPFPIAGSTWYKVQVRELEEYATENEIPYFDHWEAWPQESNDYLTEDERQPNEEGHLTWANYIIEKLISL